MTQPPARPTFYIELFIANQLSRLPANVIVQISSYLSNEYIWNFFLRYNSPTRDVLVNHYFSKVLYLHFQKDPGYEPERKREACELYELQNIIRFLDKNEDIIPQRLFIGSPDEFATYKTFIEKYQQRFSLSNQVHYQISLDGLSNDEFTFITSFLPNVHELELIISVTPELGNHLNERLAEMNNLRRFFFGGGKTCHMPIMKAPPQLESFQVRKLNIINVDKNFPPLLDTLGFRENDMTDEVFNQFKLPPHLKTLWISRNPFKNLNLSQLPRKLEVLGVGETYLSDFSTSLKGVGWPANLESIDLVHNHIDDLALKKLSEIRWPKFLKKLSIGNNSFTSLKNLFNLPDTLESLKIPSCDLQNPLINDNFRFPHYLRHLDLSEAAWNFEAIKSESKKIKFPDTLSTLDLTNCVITDLSVFHFPSNIKNLTLMANYIDDLNCYNVDGKNWQDLINLTLLDLRYNPIINTKNWQPSPKNPEVKFAVASTFTFEIEFN